MQEDRVDLASEAAEVWCVTMALEGTTAEWMVSLHNDNVSELQSFHRLLMALCKWFKDPLAQRKA